MTDITSETLKGLLEKATPGPWYHRQAGMRRLARIEADRKGEQL